MTVRARLEIYPSRDIKGTATIVGERAALKELAQALNKAADGFTGFHSATVYKGNGHDYEIFITRNIEESEWQNMPKTAEGIDFVKEYIEMRSL
jgi:hypothetical protein